MHLFNVAFYFSGAFYALFVDRTLLLPFFAVIVLYFVLGKVVGGNDVSVRKKLMMATWSHPEEGVIIVKVPARVEKVKECIAKCKEVKLTYTHFAIKAIGELLYQLPDLNGTLTMGKVSVASFSLCPTSQSTSAAWWTSTGERTWPWCWLRELTRCRSRRLLPLSAPK